MIACEYEESLTRAEIACRDHLAKSLPFSVYRDANPDNPDCGVFNVGYIYTGDHQLFAASAYHFRATLELFCRDRTELQRTIMRIMRRYPQNQDGELSGESNVLVFRIAPETNAVSAVNRTDIQTERDGKPILTYNATILFDVVFAARFD